MILRIFKLKKTKYPASNFAWDPSELRLGLPALPAWAIIVNKLGFDWRVKQKRQSPNVTARANALGLPASNPSRGSRSVHCPNVPDFYRSSL